MVRNPHIQIDGATKKSYIQSYAEAGSDRIAIHLSSVPGVNEAKDCFDQIRSYGKEPGIVIEVEEQFTSKIEDLLLFNDIKWMVVMGVPVGYGGQIFNSSVLNKISLIKLFANRNNIKMSIEIDGGLTFNNLRACNNAGADIFAGWSIIKPDSSNSLEDKLSMLKKHF